MSREIFDDSNGSMLYYLIFRLSQIEKNILIAVNQEYVGSDQTVQLKAGDEVAVIPPISGG